MKYRKHYNIYFYYLILFKKKFKNKSKYEEIEQNLGE